MAKDFFEITGGEQFASLAQGFESAVKEELETSLNDTLKVGTRIVRDTIQESNAVAFGVTLNSVTARINELSGLNFNAVGEIYFRSPADEYIDYADDGRGPGGIPPLARIRAWTRIKGIDESLAYPIARSIGARGTAVSQWSSYGRKAFLETSSARIDSVAKAEFEKLAARLQRRIDSNANNNSRTT